MLNCFILSALTLSACALKLVKDSPESPNDQKYKFVSELEGERSLQQLLQFSLLGKADEQAGEGQKSGEAKGYVSQAHDEMQCLKKKGSYKPTPSQLTANFNPFTGWSAMNNPMKDERVKKIFFINLEKSKDRKEFMEENLRHSGYPVERWPATDRTEATQENYAKFTKKFKDDMRVRHRLGTGATYLSHMRLLKHISQSPDGDGVYMILEDDVKPKHDTWAQNVMCEIEELPKDWDIYKFAGLYPSKNVCLGIPEANAYSCNMQKYRRDYMGNQGYAVTPKGAKAMLDHMSKMPPMDVDGGMMNGQWWDGHGSNIDTNFYVSKYNHAIHNLYGSSIGGSDRQDADSHSR